MGASVITGIHPLAEKLPICQKMSRCKCSLESEDNSVVTAFTKSENTMPVSIIVLFSIRLSIREANDMAKRIVPMPKEKPVRGSVASGANGRVMP